MRIRNIIEAEAQDNDILIIRFDDGTIKRVDIKPFIRNGISAQLNDQKFFSTVKVKDGYIYWDNGFDFCPEFLYHHTAQA
jgi:hypothetical protein